MKSHLLCRANEARWSMFYAFPATVGIWKLVDGRGRRHSSHGWKFRRCPSGARDGEACKNPVFAPRSHGKMAPWHPMPPHASCMDHGPGFRLNLSGPGGAPWHRWPGPWFQGPPPWDDYYGAGLILLPRFWTSWHLNLQSYLFIYNFSVSRVNFLAMLHSHLARYLLLLTLVQFT